MDCKRELEECCKIMMQMTEEELKTLKEVVDAADQPLARALIIKVEKKKEGS